MAQEHRKPPKPPHYDTAQPGQCRWCGEDVLKKDGTVNKRASWHKNCVAEYKLIHWPRVTRSAVYRRDKGVCACCGKRNTRGQWDMDHIQPLVESQGNLDYWKLPNLQTLCTDCHKEKTSREATERAARRRAEKEKKNASTRDPE